MPEGFWQQARAAAAVVLVSVVTTAAEGQVQCQATCYEKSYTVHLEFNGNGIPEPGEFLRYEVNYCNGVPPTPGGVQCTSSDRIDDLNDPLDLTLVMNPLLPGDRGGCLADDAGATACSATSGAATIDLCDIDLATDTVTVNATMNAPGGCLTYYFYTRIDADLTGTKDICNQAVGGGMSDDPRTGAGGDPTCWTLNPRAMPGVDLEIAGCPAPCTVDVARDPDVTTVRYELTIANTDDRENLTVTVEDDLPAGALAFRVINRGDFQPCGSPISPPTCANVAAPGGANGTGQVVIRDLQMTRAGGLGPSKTVVFEVDFACRPLADGVVVANQARIFSTSPDPRCDPCVSDDPGTAAADDTRFTVACAVLDRCQLMLDAAGTRAEIATAYAGRDCGSEGIHLAGLAGQVPGVAPDQQVDIVSGGPGPALTLYGWDECGCPATAHYYKGAGSPPPVRIRF